MFFGVADAPQLIEWPGKDGKPVEHTAGTEAELKVDATPADAKVKWLKGGVAVPAGAGEHFVLTDNDRTLTIKSATEADGGAWEVKASVDGQADASEKFELKIKPTADSPTGTQPPETPGEWDPQFALIAGAAIGGVTLVGLAALLALGAWLLRPHGGWRATDITVFLVVALAWLATVALFGSIYLALLSVRARARAKGSVDASVAAAAEKGWSTAVEKAFEKTPEILTAYGSLKETAALGLVALGLAGGAIGLTIAKFPDVTNPATSTLTVQSKDDKAKKTCTLQFALDGHTVSGSIPAGTYDFTLKHSKTANVQLAGSGFSAAVTAAGGKDLETSVDLSSGTYTATCKPTTAGFTPGTKKLMVKAS